MARLRWCILQTVLVAALVSLWLAGPLPKVMDSDAGWFVIGVQFVTACALGLVFAKKVGAAVRIQDLLPVVAVIAMQGGIVAALGIMADALISSGDPSKAVGGFFAALSTALYVSIAALAGYVWLVITVWAAGGPDA